MSFGCLTVGFYSEWGRTFQRGGLLPGKSSSEGARYIDLVDLISLLIFDLDVACEGREGVST